MRREGSGYACFGASVCGRFVEAPERQIAGRQIQIYVRCWLKGPLQAALRQVNCL